MKKLIFSILFGLLLLIGASPNLPVLSAGGCGGGSASTGFTMQDMGNGRWAAKYSYANGDTFVRIHDHSSGSCVVVATGCIGAME
jgi:hypothetical protein